MKKNKRYYIGVDVGGTKIFAGLVDRSGTIVGTKKAPTPQNKPAAQVGKVIMTVVTDLLAEQNVMPETIIGIGVGVPGLIKPNHRDILVTPNVNLAGYPLAANLEKQFQTTVFLGNDVNLGLLGAKWQGIGKEEDNIIGIFPGTGVGGAIIINGKLVNGAQGAAGELGHMIIDLQSKHQSAGVYGTLEALASRRAIEREIKSRIKKGQKSIITQLQKKGTATIKSGMLAEALKRKDKVVTEVINDVCHVLGKACISIRHIFNPDMIILGGGVIEACGQYMLPKIRKISDRDPFFKNIDQCKIEPSL
ncbi:MAG: ROK family protein, partial [Candidatus Omnitrophica bacterium]|nr:ROK family protein [Candidatus Omnitrophota bacterium]